jgi:hypothetical protein
LESILGTTKRQGTILQGPIPDPQELQVLQGLVDELTIRQKTTASKLNSLPSQEDVDVLENRLESLSIMLEELERSKEEVKAQWIVLTALLACSSGITVAALIRLFGF